MTANGGRIIGLSALVVSTLGRLLALHALELLGVLMTAVGVGTLPASAPRASDEE